MPLSLLCGPRGMGDFLQLKASAKMPLVGTEETTMPALQGQLSLITFPAVSEEKSEAKISFVAPAPPVLVASFSTMLPADPGAMHINVTQMPGATLMTCAPVIFVATLLPPAWPAAILNGPTMVAGIQLPSM
jgi:hypothetical protein